MKVSLALPKLVQPSGPGLSIPQTFNKHEPYGPWEVRLARCRPESQPESMKALVSWEPFFYVRVVPHWKGCIMRIPLGQKTLHTSKQLVGIYLM